MRYLRALGNFIEKVLDFVAGLPDALATFLFALTSIFAFVLAVGFMIGMGFLLFALGPVAGWIWTVVCICVSLAALWTLVEEI